MFLSAGFVHRRQGETKESVVILRGLNVSEIDPYEMFNFRTLVYPDNFERNWIALVKSSPYVSKGSRCWWLIANVMQDQALKIDTRHHM